MPAGAIADALEQLRTSAESRLAEARLPADSLSARGTPRRLVLTATGIAGKQPDEKREVKGPAKSVAFGRDGTPTGAAIGFAKKLGVPVNKLDVVSTPQGEYVLARVLGKGKPATEVLGPILAETVTSLFFPKMMRWGTGAIRFVRPLRWIVALLDGDVIPMEIAGVKSGRTSRGHRFLSAAEFEIGHSREYADKARKAFIMIDPEERRNHIRTQGNGLAAEVDGSVPWDEGLLDENVWLVEWPTALIGSFDPEYLELPRPVLITAMKKHQRYFPVEDARGNLLPKFISIRNGGDRSLDLVREGNERVLTARFADARYFFEQDRQTHLEGFLPKLGRILFQEKLGTLNKKRERLERLAAVLADEQGLSPGEIDLAVRAARLCKADLATQMVMELPALQGIIGREYALAGGEDTRVAEAISEHYLPRSAGDDLPRTELGRLLAVADRVDTLVGYVGMGIIPTGSSDPYGLRRAAQGVIQILAEDEKSPPLMEIELHAAHAYKEVNGTEFDRTVLSRDLAGLFDQRMSAFLGERGIRYDLIDATLSGGAAYTTLVSAVVRRADSLLDLSGDANFVPTVTVASRVANILRPGDLADSVEPSSTVSDRTGPQSRSVERALSLLMNEARQVNVALLKEPSEQELFDAAQTMLPDVAHHAAMYDYRGLYQILLPLRPIVDKFFDDVLVMVPDAAVRRNRLELLEFIDALYKILADFTKVVVA